MQVPFNSWCSISQQSCHTWANPQNVSNTLWVAATLDVQLAEGQVQQLLQHFARVLPQANPQNVSNTLWAATTLKQQVPPHQLEQLLVHFVMQLPSCHPQDIANTLTACSRMQYTPLQLLATLEKQPAQLLGMLEAALPQDLANMACACGRLGYIGPLLPGMLLQWTVQMLQSSKARSCLNMQCVCNLCWCAAVLDLQQYVPQVLQLAAAGTQMWPTAAAEDLYQLYQVHLWLLDSQLPTPGQGLSGVLSQQQLQQCKDSWEQQLTASTTAAKASDLQNSVLKAVQALPAGTWQQPLVLEQRTADGALSIDIAATTVSGVQLAIEADGPNHYVQPKGTPDGSTLYRNRALAARGYVVVSIPYWEWRELHGAAQKQQYLLGRLQQAAAAKAAAPAGTPGSSPEKQQPNLQRVRRRRATPPC